MRSTKALASICVLVGVFVLPTRALAQPTESPEEREPTPKTYEVYLTFDDGPVYGSDDVLDNLKSEKVVASFFVNGFNLDPKEMGANRAKWAKQVLIRMWREGHLVGNHTYSHKYNYDNALKVDVDFMDNEDAIKAASGASYDNKVFGAHGRFPGSNTWRVGKIKQDVTTRGNSTKRAGDKVSARGYRLYGWDVEWRQGKGVTPAQSPNQMAAELFRALQTGKTKKPGKVILLTHDRLFRKSKGQGTRVQALIRALRAMAKKNKVKLVFKRVDKY